jgi:L-ascorbate metabolism protein UlaG (beta-lactamase superfamily)
MYLTSLYRMSIIGAAIIMLNACSMTNPNFDASKPHHTPSGFKNRYNDEMGGFSNFLKWQWERFGKKTLPPSADLSPISPNLTLIQSPKDAQVTWVGHSTALIQIGGLNILTDPIFSEFSSPVQFVGPKRFKAPGLSLAQLPRIDVVIVSHNHYDHLDINSVRTLAAMPNAPTFYVPLGIELWFKDHVPGAKVVKADWQDKLTFSQASNNLVLQLLPVQHWSSRTPFDRKATLWGSWALSAGAKSVWFSGDLGYSQDTKDIGKQFPQGFDLALIAVGAYEPRWFMKNQHINPAEAVTIHAEIASRKSVGIHWGTFGLTDEPLDQAILDLAAAKKAQAIADSAFVLLKHGQTISF